MTRLMTSLSILFLFVIAVNGQEHGSESVAYLGTADLRAGAPIPSEPRFLSGGQPDEAVLEAIAAAGFTLVVDFRGEDEDRGIDEKEIVERLGMSYVNVPVDVPDGVNFDNAATLNQLIEKNDGRVFLHCGSGNRAGAMFALRESLLGADDEEAVAAGKAAGLMRLENTVRQRLAEE